MGAVFIAALEPWMTLPLAWYLDAIGSMFDPVYTLTSDVGFDGDPDYVPGYGQIFNPLTCPADDLPYLGQFVGVSVPTGADPTTALSLVTAEAGQARGTLASLQAAIQRNISTPWTANTAYSAGTMITYGNPVVYYLVGTAFTSGNSWQQLGLENFVGNPSFEYDTLLAAPAWWIKPSNIAPFGSHIQGGLPAGLTLNTFAVENGWAASGTNSLRVTATYSGSGGNILETFGAPISMSVGQVAQMSAEVNILTSGVTAGAYIDVLFCDSNYNIITVGGASNVVDTNGVHTLTVSTTVAPLGTAYAIVGLYNYTSSTTLDAYWDEILFSWGNSLPSYFDGDTSGYGWTSTPGDSPSAQPLPSVAPTTQYSIVERQDSTGAPNAYWISVHVLGTQLTPTNNTSAILTAINSVKPGGILINLITSASPTWAEATLEWSQAMGSWQAVASGDV
jgi:hypothetical protein